MDAALHTLLALGAVIVVGRFLARLLAAVRQPPVIGEVLAGIALGPSLLGRVSPDAYAFLLPPSTAPQLNVIAQVGVAVYMFLVGLELNLDRLRTRTRATIVISYAGIVAPFALGAVVAIYLYPAFAGDSVPFRSFALFMGIAMAITAFPVLARILADRGMSESDLGVIALTCAAVDDVTAWCLLALVAGVAQTRVDSAWLVAAQTVGFIAFMLLVVRPAAARVLSPSRPAGPGTIALALAGLAAAAATTDWIGIHAIFGAFLFGAIVPHDSGLAAALDRLKAPVAMLLLPAFFAFTGMRTRIDLLSSLEDWLVCGLIVIVASAGKFGGCFAAARATGLTLRDAAALGVLMNTRGLMELIVLNVGLDLGVIAPRLFTMMVIMAVVTTMMTTPLVDLLLRRPRGLQSRRAPDTS